MSANFAFAGQNERIGRVEGGILKDAAGYIQALAPEDQQHPDVQVALHVLLQAADHGGPMMFARMGVAKMVLRHHPARKDRPWGQRKLKRDE